MKAFESVIAEALTYRMRWVFTLFFAIKSEAHRQSVAVAASARALEDQAFIEAASNSPG